MARFVPDRGDVVWFHFTPHAGHRLALTISPRAYNGKVGLALFCPITTQLKGYPFDVILPQGLKTQGVILSDQVKSLDWRVRKAKLFEHLPSDVMEEVVAKLSTLIVQRSE